MINDVFEYSISPYFDERGSFEKIFHDVPILNTIDFKLRESFITRSHAGVVRGIHLQTDTAKNYRIIYVISGKVYDVLVDLRSNSSTYKNIETRKLSSKNPKILIVPPGVAHGFQSYTSCVILYLTSSNWNPRLDTGINPLSVNVNWPLPIKFLSERDKNLPNLADWNDYE